MTIISGDLNSLSALWYFINNINFTNSDRVIEQHS